MVCGVIAHSERSTGLGSFGQLQIVLEISRAQHVAEQVAAIDADRAVVEPLVGVADARIERLELGQRLLLGSLVHPAVLLQPLGESGAQIADQLLHLSLARRREVPLDIKLADRLAERAIDHAKPPLPAFALLRLSAQRLSVEVRNWPDRMPLAGSWSRSG
jgi:hypothetical protein